MTAPLWLDADEAPPRRLPPPPADASVDLLVLGLGMTGASAAFHAAERGLRTIALDAEGPAAGASGRNAGFLLAGPEAYYAHAVARHGRALARDVWRLNLENRDGVVALARRIGVECSLVREGSVVAAVDEAEAATLRTSARWMREDGFPATLLDARETSAAAGGTAWTAGILVPDDGMLQPARFTQGLADAAERGGARLAQGRATSLAREDGAWTARLAGGGRVRAAAVVCGLSAYAPALLAWAAERVRPVRGQVLATAPVRPNPVRRPVYAADGYLYVRPFGDRVVAGGMRQTARASEVGADDRLDARVQGAVEEALARHWPAAYAVTHRWSGAMDFSRDALPWIGEVPGEPGLLASIGYTGHGWGYGVWAGALLAEAAAGGKPAIPAWCRADRQLGPRWLVD